MNKKKCFLNERISKVANDDNECVCTTLKPNLFACFFYFCYKA